MAPRLGELKAGQEILATHITLDPTWLARYVEVVGGEGAVTPPIALVALAMRRLFAAIALPDGTVHSGQSYHARMATYAGDLLEVRWVASRAAARGGALFVNLDLAVRRGEELVLEGRTSLIVPGPAA
jgi:hypothetical protein